MNNHEIDKQIFISNYEISDIEAFGKMYVLEELMIYLPSSPTKSEKEIFQSLLGTLGLNLRIYGLDTIKQYF